MVISCRFSVVRQEIFVDIRESVIRKLMTEDKLLLITDNY